MWNLFQMLAGAKPFQTPAYAMPFVRSAASESPKRKKAEEDDIDDESDLGEEGGEKDLDDGRALEEDEKREVRPKKNRRKPLAPTKKGKPDLRQKIVVDDEKCNSPLPSPVAAPPPIAPLEPPIAPLAPPPPGPVIPMLQPPPAPFPSLPEDYALIELTRKNDPAKWKAYVQEWKTKSEEERRLINERRQLFNEAERKRCDAIVQDVIAEGQAKKGVFARLLQRS